MTPEFFLQIQGFESNESDKNNPKFSYSDLIRIMKTYTEQKIEYFKDEIIEKIKQDSLGGNIKILYTEDVVEIIKKIEPCQDE